MDVSLSDPDFQIRPMNEDEVELFYSVGRSSSLYALRIQDLRAWHRQYPEDLFVAVKRGVEVVGICIASRRLGLISGLSLKSNCSQGLEIQIALLREAFRHLSGIPKEITVPSTMRSIMHLTECKHRWNICLYSGDSTNIVPPPCDCRGYIVELAQRSFGGSFILHFATPDGTNKKLMVNETNTKPMVAIKLYSQNGLSIIGCGAVTIHDEGNLVIGPIFAPDENAAKVILRLFILYLKRIGISRTVQVYAVDRNEMKKYLEDANFLKLEPEWSRYCKTENRKLFGSFSFDDMEPITFALSALSFSML